VSLFLTGCLGYEVASAEEASRGTLKQVFERVKEAVVVIHTTERQLHPLAELPESATGVLSRFLSVKGLGSGFVIQNDEPALVVTAAHVVQSADTVTVEFSNGQRVRARIKSSSPATDLALLELERSVLGVEPIPLVDSDSTSVGDRVFVVGAPHGLEHTLTVGYVSARRQSSELAGGLARVELLQTDAAINPGNSGGPLLNMNGDAVGIVSHILSRSGGFEGMGFAVTSSLARRLLLEEPTPWSGLHAFMLAGDLAGIFNLPQPAGILVERVARASPAERLGLQPGGFRAVIQGRELLVGGDIILSVGGISVTEKPESYEKIRAYWGKLEKADVIKLKILRKGKVIDLARPINEL